jgi:hypothetical protein
VDSGDSFTPAALTPTAGVDPRVALATSLQASPGIYAVLVGSGLSSAAGIRTGWQVTQDLVRKVALAEGVPDEELGDAPERWWVSQGRSDPRYDTLLEAIAPSTAARQALLRHYFDPPLAEGGPILPTDAHRALASLCAAGRVRLVLTTNVDRLLERALEDAGAAPQVIATLADIGGMTPLPHARTTVVKLSGDYTRLDMRNTAAELAEYPAELRGLLQRALDEYGLLVVGWSGEYDRALAHEIASCPSHRYPTFWTTFHGELAEDARHLIALRRAHVIDTAGAEGFFFDLTERIARLDQRAARRRPPTALRVQRLIPENSTPQGWAVLPLLQLRAATAVALPSLETLGLIRPQQRDDLVAALGTAEITSRLHLLSSSTPASAISPDSPIIHEGLGVWQLSPDAHQSGEAASYRLGGNAMAGISALATVHLPVIGANTGSIVLALDIALSLMAPIRLAETARLLRDGLILASAILPAALEDILPAEAEVTLGEVHISAPTTMGDTTARDNELQERVELTSLGTPTRPVRPTMGFAAELGGPLTLQEATALVADAFEHMALAVGYTDPRVGIRALRHELGIATTD